MPLRRSSDRRQAGRNPRRLAWQRRLRALECGLGALFSVLLPFGIDSLLDQMAALGSSAALPERWRLSLYATCWLIGLAALFQGWFYWRRAGLAAQGALGEAVVAQALPALEREGWQFEYGVAIRAGGDVDIICTSPRGWLLTIDVKSHGGTVRCDADKLYRQYGKQRYEFEKDFLAQAMRQALAVKRLRQAAFVTPLVVFSRAQVQVSAGKLRGVYVTSLERLPGLLRSLG